MRYSWLFMLLFLFVGTAGADETSETRVLLDQIRAQSGITAKYQQNAVLDEASRKHCLYWAENFDWLNPLKQQGFLNFHHWIHSKLCA